MKMKLALERLDSTPAVILTRSQPTRWVSGMRNALGRWKFAAVLVLTLCSAFFCEQVLSAEQRKKSSADKSPKKQVSLQQEDIRLMEAGILRITNEYRSEKGLNPLELSAALGFLAQRQTVNMCNAGLLAHESDNFPEGWRKFGERLTIVGARSGAENIAFGTILKEPDHWTRTIMKGWMKSPAHRKNILNPKFRYLGVSVGACAQNLAYATQVFSVEPGRVGHGRLTR